MYNLDVNAAKKADSIGAYINETGKYIGIFTRAEKLVSGQKRTHGIGFTFKDDSGKETRFDIWTERANGEQLQGANQIHALMACLQLRNLKDSIVRVKKWDAIQGKEDVMDASCFPDLMNKKIGLLLRSEEYEKMKDNQFTGETAWKMNLFACFQAGTDLMATEILDRKTTPEQLVKAIGMLADKPLKKSSVKKSVVTQSASMNDDLDDEIPF